MESQLEVIDAFVDGERVDPIALKQALSEPDGRDYFVDAWSLREAVQQDRDHVSREASVHDRLPPAAASGGSVGRWFVAAAMVVCAAGGYVAGNWSAESAPPAAPPTAATTPATSATNATRPPRPAFPAPAPTRVIQLEFQFDAGRNGGH